ncbi:MAG: hypothetical protein ABI769_00400 [Pseudomonadota bacterium]
MRAQIVLGVHMRGDDVDRLADDDAYIRDQRGGTVGNGPDVIGEFFRDALAYQRRRRGRRWLLGEGGRGK